jgi:signal transduction histidine kinase
MMTMFRNRIVDQLNSFVDWFIPPALRAQEDVIQGVRMFLFSHMFGPFLGHTISFSMLFLEGDADWHWWVFFGCVTAFWPFLIVLRLTGWYVPLALISIQNLIFCIIWGCYFYGGMSSPIMPWFITVPLLAFFYLPTRKNRIMVSAVIFANLSAFYFLYNSLGFPETLAQGGLVVLGLISTLCAGIYVSMMALFYSSIVSSQSQLEQEVRSRQETERKLREATAQVQRATKAKSIFLAKMSHELRNPLNAIIGYTELLVESITGQTDQTSADLKAIKEAALRLLELINDLLDLSKLDAGKMQLCVERFSLSGFVNDVVAKWQPEIAAGGNKLHVRSQIDDDDMAGDQLKMHQAVGNLLSNAAKFTQNGIVMLLVKKERGAVEIAVHDTGPGINPEHIGGLFETFGNRKNETASKYGEDPGLGLPLTYRLCALMGGALRVESTVGHGSRFTMRFPGKAIAQNADKLITVSQLATAHG